MNLKRVGNVLSRARQVSRYPQRTANYTLSNTVEM